MQIALMTKTKIDGRESMARAARAFSLWRTRQDWRVPIKIWTANIRNFGIVLITVYGVVQIAQDEDAFTRLSRDQIYSIFAFVLGTYALHWIAEFIGLLQILKEMVPARMTETAPIAAPTSEAAALAASGSDRDFLAIGGVIEVARHPFLDRNLSDNGWSPEEVSVTIVDRPQRARDDDLLTPLRHFDPNNPKYWIYDCTPTFADQAARLGIEVTATDWNNVQTAYQKLVNAPALRKSVSSLTPRLHPVPNPLCLHVLVEFADESILAMRRSPQAAYNAGEFSLSFEEQLAAFDFRRPVRVMQSWFERSLCEEVFPLVKHYHDDPDGAWSLVAAHIADMRVWSLIFQEAAASYALFGVVRLKLTPTDYVKEFERLRNSRGGARDDEGRIFFVSKDEVTRLLRERTASVVSLFGETQSQLTMPLHASSAYRVLTYLACKGRR